FLPLLLQQVTITNRKVELVFPRSKREMEMYLPKVKGEDFFQTYSIDINKIGLDNRFRSNCDDSSF
ncbi:MAG: hypothetical protein WCF03_06070, partial [Nitrososphaeraceae archaeon]